MCEEIRNAVRTLRLSWSGLDITLLIPSLPLPGLSPVRP